MNILLLKKIKNLGDVGSEVSVKSGYARNFLLPQKHAVLPTKANLELVEEKKQELLKQEEALKNEAILQKEKYDNYEIIFEENVQEEDEKLFRSITLQTVLDRLKEDGFEVLKKQVNLPAGPIKVLGNDFIVNVSLHPEVSVTIPLKVIKKSNN
ncbi:MAG: 50S ribosomal protein L9 [Gammaproteobacteria bacterium]